MRRSRPILLLVAAALLASAVAAPASAAPASPVTFTILHTNDFHGNLEWKSGGSSSNPGSGPGRRVREQRPRRRSARPRRSCVDAGDEMQGSLLSNLQKGDPTIATYNAMGYDVATFGNHEFDWGKDVLAARVAEAAYPYVSANIVVRTTPATARPPAGRRPPFVDAPYEIKTIGTAPNAAKVALHRRHDPGDADRSRSPSATAGLCFKDPAESILHYYDAMKADGADVIVVLSHLGYARRRLRLRAADLRRPDAGQEADHRRQAGEPDHRRPQPHEPRDRDRGHGRRQARLDGRRQARYNGRRVGRADVTVNPDGKVGDRLEPTSSSPTAERRSRRRPRSRPWSTSYANDPGVPGADQPGDRLDERADRAELRRRLADGRLRQRRDLRRAEHRRHADQRRRHRVQQRRAACAPTSAVPRIRAS